MPASLTRTVRFFALHRYFRPDWTDAQNQAAFGPLTDEPGHGHDYECAVTVAGPLDETRGTIVDLAVLDRVLAKEVVAPFAGKHLNLDVPAFAYGRALPTCEALAAYLYQRIASHLPPGVILERVRIMEDPTLYADYTGPT